MEEKRFTLRMDGELFEEIVSLAKKNRRSTAKEIEYAVAQYVLKEKESAILDSVNMDNLTKDQSSDVLKQLRELHKKYNR